MAQVHDLVAHSPEAILTSRDSQGILRASLVRVRPGESDRVFVAGDASLMSQLRRSSDVLLTYADRQSGRWLVLNGVVQPADRASAFDHLPVWLGGGNSSSHSEVAVRILAADLWE
jgi:hypothetical protein